MIKSFTPAIFWDTEISKLDTEKHCAYIIERVLNFGTLEDWKLLKKMYHKKKIRSENLELKNLDPKAVSFLSNYLKISKTKFQCYSPKPSNHEHLSF